MMKLTICKLCESAKVPSYAHEGDACFDLFAAEPTVLPPPPTTSAGDGKGE